MKEHPLYVVAYTLLVCAFSALLLTTAQVHWAERIAANENFARIAAMVGAAGFLRDGMEQEAVIDLYTRQIKAVKHGDMALFEARDADDAIVAYLVEIEGQGRYGVIRGILAFAPDRQHIHALRIYEQNETPGLGGLIGSMEWLSQFDRLPMVVDGKPGIRISSSESGPNVVDAITGASMTTFSLSQIINTMVHRFLSGGATVQPLDLGVDADAVTRATPGYPKGFKAPPHLREEIRREDFMVPEGISNIALNCPVTSNLGDEDPLRGTVSQVTDGIKKSDEQDYVEMFPGEPQWVQIDLGASKEIFSICVWHYYKNPIVYRDVIVQIADDAEFSENVRTIFNNDHDNSSGLGEGKDTAYFARWWGELLDTRRGEDKLDGTFARYVRVYTNGGEADEDTRFVEVAVFGR
ncbi:MAG: FMN-binding protein [Lentisphaeria bacterium]|jgi:Na+-transporting NADH:ubiquinone oxidoreductase subunit NqrC